jgi:hypothetical protein
MSEEKSERVFVMICAETFNDLLIERRLYPLESIDIQLFLHLCLSAANNALTVKANIQSLSVLFSLSEKTIYSSIQRLRHSDLIRQKEHSFMMNPDYVKFGRKQIQALQRVNWAKLKSHSRSETHSIKNIQASMNLHSY